MFGIVDSGQKNLGNGLKMHLDAGQLKSYSGSGTIWYDLSGNGYTGSLLNGPTFNSTANGGGFFFDGTNDRWEGRGFLPGTTPFTVECVFKFVTNTLQFDTLCSSGGYHDGGSQAVGFGFGSDSSNNIFWHMRSTSTYTHYVDLLTPPANDTFYHVAGTRAFRSNAEYTVGYLNGVVKGSTTGSAGINLNMNNNFFQANSIFDARNTYGILGTYCWGYGPAPTGSLYLVRIYDRELSSSEVKTNYEAYKSRFGL